MPYSILTYPGDGVTTTWPINFTLGFISRDDVKCRVGAEVDGLNQPVYRTLTWISDGLVEVQGTPAAIGQNVEFTRTVAKDALVHDYQDGAPITENNLDDSNKQLIMLLHEILDDRLRVPPASNWDMNAKRIVNLADGIDLTDAVTVQQAAQAIALTPTAVQAAADAAQALADAEAAASAAEAILVGAMQKTQNLNDVSDKATSRANLDVYSKASVDAAINAVTPPAGVIFPYAGVSAPTGFLLCYGQAVSRTTYSALFAVIGTTYGSGDGTTTFKVPDLRGRVIAGQDDMGGTSANRLTGLTGGVDGDTLGATGGEEAHTLTTAEMADHKHWAFANVNPTQNNTTNQLTASAQVASFNITSTNSTNYTMEDTATEATIGLTSNPTTASGTAHNNVQPTLILNYIIKH